MAYRSVLILDDDLAARHHLVSIIAQGPYAFMKIFEATTVEGGLRCVKEHRPCVVFLDPSVQGGSDDFIRYLTRVFPHNALVVTTQLKMFEVAYQAINAGCQGYLLKPTSRTEVLDLLNRVVSIGQEGEAPIDLGNPILSAVAYLEQHFSEPITLAEIAQLVYLSPSYFSRQFKLEMQMTFVEYLTHLRMKQAKQRLRMTDLPIDMVAEECGFRRASYFTTQFHRIQGISPSEYRRRFRDRLSSKSLEN
jgi:YesN/AraC family two-component response regulator